MRSTSGNFEMYIRQAGPTTYRQVLKEIRQKEIFKIIVDTNPSNIYFLFRAVSRVRLFFCFHRRGNSETSGCGDKASCGLSSAVRGAVVRPHVL